MAKGRKTGGRKPNTPNKNKGELLQQIRARLGDTEWNPVIEMAVFSQEPDVEPQLKMTALKEVSRYTVPVPKALDLNVSGGVELRVFTGIPLGADDEDGT